MPEGGGKVPNGVPVTEGTEDKVPNNDVSDGVLDNNQDNDDIPNDDGLSPDEIDDLPTPPTPLSPPEDVDNTPALPEEWYPLRKAFKLLCTIPFIHASKHMKEATFNFDLINLGYKTFEVRT